jgi:hypothetical protein
LLVDGDDTYDASIAPRLVDALIGNRLDTINVSRSASHSDSYRAGHRFGNWFLVAVVSWVFGRRFQDMLPAIVFSVDASQKFPAHSQGFEIETELTVHALELIKSPDPRNPRPRIKNGLKDRPASSGPSVTE